MAEAPKHRKKLKRITRVAWVFFLAGIIGFPLYIWGVSSNYNNWFGELPSYSQLENPTQSLTSVMYTADGLQLGSGYYRDNRNPVTYDELGPNLVQALLAAEDIRFEEHSGIDLPSMFRVAFGVLTFKRRGGGSTISQQLAKNLFSTRVVPAEEKGKLENTFLKELIYKTKEWILSVRLEKSYTKQEIMAMYYNTVEFGNNSFGVKSAAKTYFGKLPQELSVEEAAVLAGMQKRVTYYRPDINPDNAKRRRNVVMSQMVKYDFLEKERYDSLKVNAIDMSNFKRQDQNQGLAQYFREEARKELRVLAQNLGYDLYADGIKIYTTIDSRMQQYAEDAMDSAMGKLQLHFDTLLTNEDRALWIDSKNRPIEDALENFATRTSAYRNLVKEHGKESDSVEYYMNLPKTMRLFSWNGEIDTTLSSIDSIRYYKQFLQAGFLSIDPKSGGIKAWVGGINYAHFKYDHVRLGKRQPGSLFKPFVYASAVEQNYSPCMVFKDEAVAISTGNGGEIWSPSNAESRYSGDEMTLKLAMAKSVNSITARVMDIVKPSKVVDMAKRLGIKSRIPAYYSIALGTEDVSLEEVVGAYGTFANKGTHIEPYYIERIEDRFGNEIYRNVPRQSRAISEDVAYVMLNMLQETVKSGSGQRISWQYQLVDSKQEKNSIGAKTGTTQNGSDGWFMSVTNELVSAAWVGGDERSIRFSRWADGQGARTAMPIVGLYLSKVYADSSLGFEKTLFERPENLKMEIDCSLFEQIAIPSDTTDTIIFDDDIY